MRKSAAFFFITIGDLFGSYGIDRACPQIKRIQAVQDGGPVVDRNVVFEHVEYVSVVTCRIDRRVAARAVRLQAERFIDQVVLIHKSKRCAGMGTRPGSHLTGFRQRIQIGIGRVLCMPDHQGRNEQKRDRFSLVCADEHYEQTDPCIPPYDGIADGKQRPQQSDGNKKEGSIFFQVFQCAGFEQHDKRKHRQQGFGSCV